MSLPANEAEAATPTQPKKGQQTDNFRPAENGEETKETDDEHTMTTTTAAAAVHVNLATPADDNAEDIDQQEKAVDDNIKVEKADADNPIEVNQQDVSSTVIADDKSMSDAHSGVDVDATCTAAAANKEELSSSSDKSREPIPIPQHVLYRSTKTREEESKLAKSLGYPNGWHVVRVVPHPADLVLLDAIKANGSKSSSCIMHDSNNILSFDEDNSKNWRETMDGLQSVTHAVQDVIGSSYMDRIFAGAPGSGCDMYFNHGAAMGAAMKWEVGVSTGYEAKGGQALPREPKYKGGDSVEVFYQEENETENAWYYAEVVKVKEYYNDIRYTVFFPEEEATQENISEENMRRATRKPPAKKEEPKGNKKTKVELPTPGRKRKGPTSQLSAKEVKVRSKKAKIMGFPEGWLVVVADNYKTKIWNPEGQVFYSKKKAIASMEIAPSSSSSEEEDCDVRPRARRAKRANKDKRRKSRRKNSGEKPKYNLDEDGVVEDDPNDLIPYTKPGEAGSDAGPTSATGEVDVDVDDPPWRREGHTFIGRLVEHTYRCEVRRKVTLTGIVTGWLDDTDVDSKGNPAYVSDRSKEPAKLFHVDFDETADITGTDMDESEVMAQLVHPEDD